MVRLELMSRALSLMALCAVAALADHAAPQAELKGLAAPQGVAASPRSVASIVTADGGITELFSKDVADPLAKIDGKPAGLAFDADSNLFAAAGSTIAKITPWGETSVFVTKCGSTPLVSPNRLAMAEGGLYFTDTGASLVCKADPAGKTTVVTSKIKAPTGIAVSADGRSLYVADQSNRIWKVVQDGNANAILTTVAGPGKISGMALDERGNLYAALNGGGAVVAFDARGKKIDSYAVGGPAVTDVAFGGPGLNDLYITEASTGALYKVRAPYRVQRLPWESNAPLRITDPVDGAILNRHDGIESATGLRINVRGRARNAQSVRVNGAVVPVRNGKFETQVMLSQRETRIRVEAAGQAHEVTALWDRGSVRRYRVSIDDNILFLKDIAQHADSYKSIFENEYLAFWREMHRKYGAKIHFNVYYETDGFNLSQMPEKFRSEWQANADWIHLSFHAKANDPDRPYLHSSAERIREDSRKVLAEVERFAGKEVIGPATTVHWGATTQAAVHALRADGTKVYVGYFDPIADTPVVSYYLPWEQWQYLSHHDYWKDMKEDIVFVRHDVVMNLYPPEEIVRRLDKIGADPHQSEIIELMIHEQYFYPDYKSYEPDYRQRVEAGIAWAAKRGYQPVMVSFE